MTTGPSWPPTQPTGPTGPGRFRPSEGPDADPIAGLDTWPRFGERIRDMERLFLQAANVLDQPVQPTSYPQGVNGHEADAGFQVIAFQIEAALRELRRLGDLTSPPVGSAVKLPARREAAPSAAPVAEGRPGGPPVPGAGAALPFGYLGPRHP